MENSDGGRLLHCYTETSKGVTLLPISVTSHVQAVAKGVGGFFFAYQGCVAKSVGCLHAHTAEEVKMDFQGTGGVASPPAELSAIKLSFSTSSPCVHTLPPAALPDSAGGERLASMYVRSSALIHLSSAGEELNSVIQSAYHTQPRPPNT